MAAARLTAARFIESRSVVHRYADALAPLVERQHLEATSLREGAQILGPVDYEGRHLWFLDMSSLSTTGSFKDWVAAVTVARARQDRLRVFVTQSSGNTANALARYAAHIGIGAVILYPALSRYKVNSEIAKRRGITLVEVDGTEATLKDYTQAFSLRYGIPWLPGLDRQIAGNKLRAYFVNDATRLLGHEFDWHVQALSSAYGIFGFYAGVAELDAQRSWLGTRPRFLGIQQAAVAPFYEDLYGRSAPTDRLLEPTLFRSRPTEDLLQRMRTICRDTRGRIRVLRSRTFRDRLTEGQQILSSVGLRLSRRNGAARLLELSPLISLVGTLEAIADGDVAAGQHVLLAVTGGCFERSDEIYVPTNSIRTGRLNDLWTIGDRLFGRPLGRHL